MPNFSGVAGLIFKSQAMKMLLSSILEQRYVIKFLEKKQNGPKEIHCNLKTIYGDGAMKRMQVYWWVSEVHRGREDVFDSPRPRRPTEIGIDEIMVHWLELDPYATVQKLTGSLGILPQTMATHIRSGLSMKYFHLRRIPHLLTSNQKAMRLEAAKVMAQQLAVYANTGFQHLLTGDESWMAHDDTPSRMWTMAWSDVDPIARAINYPRKTMMRVFFSFNGIALIDILPEKAKLSS
jgi:hypothetical protein